MAERSGSEESGGAVGFLQRWSRRKGGVAGDAEAEERPDAVSPEVTDGAAESGVETPEDDDGDARIDARSGKRFDELTDADMPAPESLGPDADVSAFFARGVSQAVRLSALRALWHSTKFNQVDLMAEYSGNFTGYEKLGDIVPHDLQRAAKREMDRARERQEALEARAREDAEARRAGAERHEQARLDAEADDDAGQDDEAGQNEPAAAQQSGSNGTGTGEPEGAPARGVEGHDRFGEASGGEPGAPDDRV